MILQALAVGQLKTNCYLVGCPHTHEALVIDPGGDAEDILSAVRELGVQVRRIALTHFHFDHVLAVEPVRSATGASLLIHKDDAQHLTNPPALFRFFVPGTPRGLVADRTLQDGDTLAVGELTVKVLHTPGHSPGGISLWMPAEGVVFCGDTLFRDGLGRTDFPGSSYEMLVESIHNKLFTLPDETMVYPGHGPPTTIGYERRNSPWLDSRAP